MNARKAKRLRAQARDESVGQPWAHYVLARRQDGSDEHMILFPACGKAIYRKLKRAARAV